MKKLFLILAIFTTRLGFGQCSNLLMIDFHGGTSGNVITTNTLDASIVNGGGATTYIWPPATPLTYQSTAHHTESSASSITFCPSTVYTDDPGKPGLAYDNYVGKNCVGCNNQSGISVLFATSSAGMRTFGGWWMTTIPDNIGTGQGWVDTATLKQGVGTYTNISLEPVNATTLGLFCECGTGGTNHNDYFPVKSGHWYFIEGEVTPNGSDEIAVYDEFGRPIRSAVSNALTIAGLGNGGSGNVDRFNLGRDGGNDGTWLAGTFQYYDKWFACWTGTCTWPFAPPLAAPAPLWNGIVDQERAVDWSNVGVLGGVLSANWSQCGATISAGASAATISGAIRHTGAGYTSCGSNTYVLLGVGTFNLSDTITFGTTNNSELRGSGPMATKLHWTALGTSCTGTATAVCVSGNGLTEDSAAVQPGQSQSCSWTAGYAKGSTVLTLNGCGGTPPLNGILVLDQPNDTTAQSGFFACDTVGTCATNAGSFGRLISGVRSSQQQFVKITAISGSGSGPYTVTIFPGLYAANWGVRSKSPGAWWTGNQIQNVGISNLTLDYSAIATSGMMGTVFLNASGAWMSNVRSIGNTILRNHVWDTISNRVTIQNSYFYGTGSGSSSYCLEPQETSDNLYINNIFQHCTNGIINGASTGNVFAYNYNVDMFSPGGFMSGNYIGHIAGEYLNLDEGNVVPQVTKDDVHGSVGLNTVFRDRLAGYEAGKTSGTISVQLNSYARQNNFIGNVWGTPSYHTHLYDDVSAFGGPNGDPDHSITNSGWSGSGQTNAGGVPSDTSVFTTTMFWGNYAACTGGTGCGAARWNTGELGGNSTPPNQTLPASFFLSAKPSWWVDGIGHTTVQWPAIGPDVTASDSTGHADVIPAQACYTNTVIDTGTIKAFDAAPCYAPTGPSQYTVTVSKSGSGTGTLTSTPGGINCGATCSYAFSSGTNISISQSTSDVFGGWGGTCGCSGTGSCSFSISANCTVTATFTVRTITLAPSSLTFANQNLNTTSASQAITLTNGTVGDLTISNIALQTGSQFAISANSCPSSPATLAVSNACTVSVTFTPTSIGTKTDSLRFTDNATGSPQSISISGIGVTTAATPSCTPAGGSYTGSQTVTCTDSSPGAVMCYTTNGTTPDPNDAGTCTTGTLYFTAISIPNTTVLRVVAGGTSYVDSAVLLNTYTITQPTVRSTILGSGKISGGWKLLGTSASVTEVQGFAALPLVFVDDTMCNPAGGIYDTEVLLGTTNNIGPNVTGSAVGQPYPLTIPGLRDAINNWRDNADNSSQTPHFADRWWRIKVPAGTNLHDSTYPANNAMLTLSGKLNGTTEPSKCLVIESTTPLPAQMACSHGLPGFGGTRNPGCSSPNDKASMWKVMADSIPLAGNSIVYAGYDETTSTYSNHIVLRDVEITLAPGSAQSYTGSGAKPPKLFSASAGGHGVPPPNHVATHLGIERFYVHGTNPGDAGQPTSGPAIDAAGNCKAWDFSGTVNTVNADASHGTVTYVSGDYFGATFTVGSAIIINGVSYTISAFDPSTSNNVLTINGQPGTQTGVAYSEANPPSNYTPGCGDDVQTGLALNCDYCWARFGYIEKIHWWQSESHAAAFGFDAGPVHFFDNWVEAGSAGLFSGGSPVDTAGGPGTDNVVERNYLGRDLGWRMLSATTGGGPYPPFGCGTLDGVAGHNTCPFRWAIKNSLELKLGIRNWIKGNIIEGTWGDGQSGYAVLITVKTCSNLCGIFDSVTGLPKTQISDIRFESNWIRNSQNSVQLYSRSSGYGNGGGMSMPIKNLDFVNNLITNIGDSRQFGSGGGAWAWTNGEEFFLCSMSHVGTLVTANCQPELQDVHESITKISSVSDVVTIHHTNRVDPYLCLTDTATCVAAGQIVSITNHAGWNGNFAMTATDSGAWAADGTGGSDVIYTDTTNHPGTATLCDNAGATKCSTLIAANDIMLSSLAFKMTDISIGDKVYAYNASGTDTTCTTAGYATGTASLPLAATGTVTTGRTVKYSMTVAPTGASASCLISNGIGFPQNVLVSHNTFLTSEKHAITNYNSKWQSQNNYFHDNVFAGNDATTKSFLYCNSFFNQEGTSAYACWDAPTFQFYHNVMQGRSSANWSVVGCPNGLTCPNAFPTTVNCATATADATCLGFSGFMGATPSVTFPTGACTGTNPYNCPLMTLPWSDKFNLSHLTYVTSSSYKNQGVDVSAMTAAMTH